MSSAAYERGARERGMPALVWDAGDDGDLHQQLGGV
jgi:hypothetical protein